MVGVAIGLTALLDFALEKRFPGRKTGRLERGVRTTSLVLGFFLYAVSWAVFSVSAQFLDFDGLGFLSQNSSIVLGYAQVLHPVLLYGLPPLLVVVGIPLAWGLARVSHAIPAGPFLRVTGVLFGFCVLLAAAGGFVAGAVDRHVLDGIRGLQHPFPKLYQQRRARSTGPFVRLVASAVRPGLTAKAASARFRRPALVDLETYAATVNRSEMQSLNVVLVVVDSLRSDILRVYGGSRQVMPTLEVLGAESQIFLDSYSQASHTHISTPCPLISQYPLRESDVHYYPAQLPYPRVAVYEILHVLGWRTGFVSSQDETWGGMSNLWKSPHLEHFVHPGLMDPARHRKVRISGEERRLLGHVDDAVTVEEGLRWVGADHGRPFFLYLNLQNAHVPHDLPTGFPARFSSVPGAGAEELYADCARYVDLQLGRLIDGLREKGVWDRTLFILTADHGESFQEVGGFGHAGKLQENVMRVPLIFRVPGRPAGRDSRPAQGIDVPPSILSLLGLPPHPGFQGLDLFGSEPVKDRSRFLVSQSMMADQYAVVRGRWKLIYDGHLGWHTLYDLLADPDERKDLSEESPRIVADLSGRLSGWWTVQLSYYGDPARCRTEFPPIFLE